MNKREIDEYLENLWYMKENEKDSLDDLKEALGGEFNADIVDELLVENLIEPIKEDNKITFTENGEQYARKIVRAHRLAERLLYDAMGRNIEDGACEFEHTVTPELVDSICIMLGHPKECPHGLPIPESECCRSSAKTIESSVQHLTDLEVGECARIAYINCSSDHNLHKLNSLQIRPGVEIRLHQKYPSYVVECENASIALDKEIADNICVWAEECQFKPDDNKNDRTENKRSRFFARGFKFRKK